ncbi:hypothetical protein Tco_1218746 [Tanacetum coccineum]
MTEFPQMDSGLVVPVFTQGDDLIACLNKAMDFLTAVASSRFPSTNNQLRTSSNLRNQATIQDGREGRQGLLNVIIVNVNDTWQDNALSLRGQGMLHGLRKRQCWLKHSRRSSFPNTAAFQTKDLDAYDSDCDDVSNAKAVLMANLSNYGSNIISEVPHFEPNHTYMDNQSVHPMKGFEQTSVVDFTNNEITSDSNIIPYSQYLQETQQSAVQDTSLYAQQDSMILFVIEQMSKQMINHEKLALKQQIDSLEQNLSNQIKEKESLLQTFTVFKNESKEKESKYMDKEIDLEKKIKELDNIVYKVGQSAQTVHMLTKPQVFYDDTHKQALGYQNPFYLKKAQRIKPTLYDGSVISSQHVASPVIDDEETLILEEVNFGKRFVPQQELSTEQAFWLQLSNCNTDQSDISPVKIEAPRELPKVSLVNTSLKKLKYHLVQFDTMVKKRITPDAIIEGEWGNYGVLVSIKEDMAYLCLHFTKDHKGSRINTSMDKPNITFEEYIRLKEEKAHRHSKVYNWETAKYGKIWYDEDVHDLRSVETEFPAIVFNDELSSEKTLSCEPTVSSLDNNEIDFRISFDESDDEDYTVIFDKNSFSYKTDSENDNKKVNVPSFTSPEPKVSCFNDLDFFKDFENEFLAIVYNDALTSKSDFLTEPTLSPQHIDEFDLKDETSLSDYDEVEGYIEEIVHDFEDRLETIFGRQVNRVHVLDFKGLTPEMRQDLAERLRMIYTRDDGHEILVSHAWRRVFEIQAPLVHEFILEFFSTYRIGSEMRLDADDTLCFQLEGARHSMTWRQFILALGGRHLKRYTKGRKSGARLLGGHFIRCLAHYFGLVSDDGLRGLSVVTHDLPLIDMGELVKLNICMEVKEDRTWVAQGVERQPVATATALGGAKDTPDVDEGAQVVPAPVHAPPPPPLTAGRTMPHRLGRLKEEIQGLHQDVGSLCGLVKRSMTNQGRFST